MKVLQQAKKYILTLALAVFLIPSNSIAQTDGAFYCGTIDSMTWYPVPAIDTIKAVVIHACSTGASTIQLPSWARGIWDSSKQLSVPRFYKDNSLNKYIMTAVVQGSGNNCFTAAIPPLDPYAIGGEDEQASHLFFDSILTKADDSLLLFRAFANQPFPCE